MPALTGHGRASKTAHATRTRPQAVRSSQTQPGYPLPGCHPGLRHDRPARWVHPSYRVVTARVKRGRQHRCRSPAHTGVAVAILSLIVWMPGIRSRPGALTRGVSPGFAGPLSISLGKSPYAVKTPTAHCRRPINACAYPSSWPGAGWNAAWPGNGGRSSLIGTQLAFSATYLCPCGCLANRVSSVPRRIPRTFGFAERYA